MIKNRLTVVFTILSALALGACGGSSSGGGGGGGGATSASTPRYAFVANQLDDSVSSYVVDSSTGRLTYIGKTAAGTNPVSVTVDPSGQYAYVANYGSSNVSQYTIGADGSLTAMTTATVTAGTDPVSVTTTGTWQ